MKFPNVFLVLLLTTALAQTQLASSWMPLTPLVTSGSVSLLASSAPVKGYSTSDTFFTYTVPFGITFSSNPSVILGITSMEIVRTDNRVMVENKIESITSTSFTDLLQINTTNYIVTFKVGYYAVNNNELDFFTMGSYSGFPNLMNNGAAATQTATFSIPLSIKELSFIPTDTHILSLYIGSFDMINCTAQYSIKLTGTLGTEVQYPSFSLTLATSGGNITSFSMYYMVVHTNTSILEYNLFVDSGSVTGAAGTQSAPPTFTSSIQTNFFIGLSGFTANSAANFDFNQVATSPWTLTSTAGYTDITLNYLNVRVKHCNSSTYKYYYPSNDTCQAKCVAFLTQKYGLNICPACSTRCMTCWTNNSNWCTACRATEMRTVDTATGLCPCTSGYVEDTSGSCVTCHYTCTTCNGSAATNCLTCDTSRVYAEAAGTCSCNSGLTDTGLRVCVATACAAGTFQNGSACQACHYSCATCNLTATNCLTCPSSSSRTLASNTCPCDAATFDNGVAVCVACAGTCATCVNSATYCTSCAAVTGVELQSGQCVCTLNHYNSSGTCVACDTKCLSCNNSATNCTSCPNTRLLSGTNTCDCAPGYFESSNVLCTACDYTCLTCEGTATNCTTSCDASRTFTAGPPNSCPCNPGLNDVGVAVCTASTCTAGQYDPGTGVCAACHYSCLTCSINSTNCLSCPTSSSRTTLVNGACPCDSGFYDNGTAVCVACHYSCTNCNSSIQCLTCPATRSLVGASCVCNSGYDAGVAACAACDYTCLTCFSSATSCSSCVGNRTLSGTKCPCVNGMFDNGVVTCVICDITCQTCNISSTNCTSCPATRNLTSNTCPCNDGYYSDGNKTCLVCDYTCLTCSTSATNCGSCVTGTHRTYGANLCPCDSGYFENGVSICATCHYTCLTCVTTADNCQSCPAASGRTQSGSTCPCDAGKYDAGVAICANCHYSCTTCTAGTTSACGSCDASRTLTSGVCVCNTGLYDNGVAVCPACNYRCATCSLNALNCTTCPATRTLNGTDCPCNAGSFDNGVAACVVCDTTCLTCSGSSASNCTSCPATRVLVVGSCVCESGLYAPSPAAATCPACSSTCLTCVTTATNCQSCAPTRTLGGGLCTCNAGYYDSGAVACPACDYKCLTCITTATNCQSCPVGSSRSGSTCDCAIGKFDNGVVNCATCDVTCSTCLGSATTCTSCPADRTLTSGACICNSGMYGIANSALCAACDYTCLSCSGSATNCTSCATTRTLVNGSCNVNTGFYDVGVAVAQPCNMICGSCRGSASNCTTCPSTRTLVGNSCLCNPGFQDVGATQCTSVTLDYVQNIIQTVCWCFLAVIGIMFKYLYGVKHRIVAHIFFMVLTVFASIGATAAMVYLRQLTVPGISAQDFRSYLIIVYICIAWMVLQVLLGIASRIAQASLSANPKVILVLRAIHKYSGYLLVLLCQGYVVLGWAVINLPIAVGVVMAEIILVLGIFIALKLKYGTGLNVAEKNDIVHAKSVGAVEDDSIEEMMNLPYNDPRVQLRDFVVFDDKLYANSGPEAQSAGNNVGRLLNGREIDRFIYGNNTLEKYPDVHPFPDSRQALSLLGNPIGSVPRNPSASFPSSTYQATGQLHLSADLSLYSFVPQSDEKIQVDDFKNLRHIGQYFVVEAFDKVKLFYSALSQMKGNRLLCDHVVKALVPAERLLGKSWEVVNWNKDFSEDASLELLGGGAGGDAGLSSSAKLLGEEVELPLLIRTEKDDEFTEKLARKPHTPVTIEGPKGRGICLDAVPSGEIAVITAGTGLFAFLDLIDLIFKATVKHQTIPLSDVRLGEQTLAKHSFSFLISAKNTQELVIPDQINLICKANPAHAQFRLQLRERIPTWAFPNGTMRQKFSGATINEYVMKLNKLQMVYVCGPSDVVGDVVKSLKEAGVTDDKIFIV